MANFWQERSPAAPTLSDESTLLLLPEASHTQQLGLQQIPRPGPQSNLSSPIASYHQLQTTQYHPGTIDQSSSPAIFWCSTTFCLGSGPEGSRCPSCLPTIRNHTKSRSVTHPSGYQAMIPNRWSDEENESIANFNESAYSANMSTTDRQTNEQHSQLTRLAKRPATPAGPRLQQRKRQAQPSSQQFQQQVDSKKIMGRPLTEEEYKKAREAEQARQVLLAYETHSDRMKEKAKEQANHEYWLKEAEKAQKLVEAEGWVDEASML
jgi:hypothetical protein